MGQPCSSVSGLDEGIALTGDYRVARAAFVEAVKHRPGGGELRGYMPISNSIGGVTPILG